jgi:hypothetical protein
VSSGHGRQEQLTNQKEKKKTKLIKKPVFLCTTGRDQ